MKTLSILAGILILFSTPLKADSFQLKKVVSGLGIPWGLSFISEHEILYTERKGKLGILDTHTGKRRNITGLPKILVKGQGGFMDVAIAPDYHQHNWIYFTFSKDINGLGATTLSRAKLKNNQLHQWQDLLVTKSSSRTSRHFGSRIAFDDQGYIYFSVGDRGLRDNAQDLKNHAGSIIRLKRNGDIPQDNPFVNNNTALDEIWSYGHRNPQGLVWDNNNKRLWTIEHGPRGGDEINLVEKGKNYGWPVISFGKEYWGPISVGEGTHRKGMQQPVKYYVPSIAPGSLLYYDGKAFPEWQGKLFAGALKLKHLNMISLSKDAKSATENRLLENLGKRIRALVQSPEGWIYFSTDSGSIYRILPTP